METLNLSNWHQMHGLNALYLTSRIRIHLMALKGESRVILPMDSIKFTLNEWQAKWTGSPEPSNVGANEIGTHIAKLYDILQGYGIMLTFDIIWEVYVTCRELERRQMTNCPLAVYDTEEQVNCVDKMIPIVLKRLDESNLEDPSGSGRDFMEKLVNHFEAEVQDMLVVEPSGDWEFIFKGLHRLFNHMLTLRSVEYNLTHDTRLKLLDVVRTEAKAGKFSTYMTSQILEHLEQPPSQMEYDQQYLKVFNDLLSKPSQSLLDGIINYLKLHQEADHKNRKIVSVAVLLQSLNAFSLVPLENLEEESFFTKNIRTKLLTKLLASLGKQGDPMLEREFESQRSLERLIQEINEVQFAIEMEFATRSAEQCAESNSCYLPALWKPEIEAILWRADQAWPSNVPSDETLTKANEERGRLFALIAKDTVPMSELQQCLDHFKQLGLHEDFKEVWDIIQEIDGVIRFPIDVEQAVDEIKKIVPTPKNFDEITAQFLAIEHLNGFPKDSSIYFYDKLLKDFVDFIKGEEGKPDGGDHIRRSTFFMVFRRAHRLLLFKSKYNQIARIYRSPKQNHTLKKRTSLFEALINYNSVPGIDYQTLCSHIDVTIELQKYIDITSRSTINPAEAEDIKQLETTKIPQCNLIQGLVTKDVVAGDPGTNEDKLLKLLSILHKQMEIFGPIFVHFENTAVLSTQARFNIGRIWQNSLGYSVEGEKAQGVYDGRALQKLESRFREKPEAYTCRYIAFTI